MSVPAIPENDVAGIDVPGRNLRWLVNADLLGAKYMSWCVISVARGDRVRPAHSHPNSGEAIITGDRTSAGKWKSFTAATGSDGPDPAGPGSHGS